MDCRQALSTYPRQANESKNKWFKRVAELTGLHHKSLDKHYYKYRNFVETQRKYDKNGNVISRVEKLQQAEFGRCSRWFGVIKSKHKCNNWAAMVNTHKRKPK
jgi:hypothetical protein